MQHGVLGTADIDIYRQPLVNLLTRGKNLTVHWIRETEIVPRRAHECIHGIAFALGCGTALWTLAVTEALGIIEGRFTGRLKIDIQRQFYRQIGFRNRHFSANITIDDRDRRAPIALPRDQPIAQTIIDSPLADPLLL